MFWILVRVVGVLGTVLEADVATIAVDSELGSVPAISDSPAWLAALKVRALASRQVVAKKRIRCFCLEIVIAATII